MGSLLVLPGCSLTGFSERNFQGWWERFPGPLVLPAGPEQFG